MPYEPLYETVLRFVVIVPLERLMVLSANGRQLAFWFVLNDRDGNSADLLWSKSSRLDAAEILFC